MWDLSDVLMGVMALINIPVILILSGIAFKAIQDYEVQLKQGINPVFKKCRHRSSSKNRFLEIKQDNGGDCPNHRIISPNFYILYFITKTFCVLMDSFLLFVTVVFFIEINIGYSTWNTDPDKHCHNRHNLKIRNC